MLVSAFAALVFDVVLVSGFGVTVFEAVLVAGFGAPIVGVVVVSGPVAARGSLEAPRGDGDAAVREMGFGVVPVRDFVEAISDFDGATILRVARD